MQVPFFIEKNVKVKIPHPPKLTHAQWLVGIVAAGTPGTGPGMPMPGRA